MGVLFTLKIHPPRSFLPWISITVPIISLRPHRCTNSCTLLQQHPLVSGLNSRDAAVQCHILWCCGRIDSVSDSVSDGLSRTVRGSTEVLYRRLKDHSRLGNERDAHCVQCNLASNAALTTVLRVALPPFFATPLSPFSMGLLLFVVEIVTRETLSPFFVKVTSSRPPVWKSILVSLNSATLYHRMRCDTN